MHLPNKKDWSNWDASPNFAPRELLGKSPRTWIAVAECGILCRREGVEVEVNVYKGSTDPVLILDGCFQDWQAISRQCC